MQQIVIQKDCWQMQVAVLEDGRLAEYFLQHNDDSPVCGSIYRGVVEAVLPGMQAAFVDIGWMRNAYLALEDVELPEEMVGCKPSIRDVLQVGQPVVVQVKKEAVDAKGPKVSNKLSLTGRTLVLVPGKPYAAVSKKIPQAETRQALKERVDELLVSRSDGSFGMIVRTAGQYCTAEEMDREFIWLAGQWQALQQAIGQAQKPGLIAANWDLALQVVRDCAHEVDLEGIYVNDYALYEQLQQQVVSRKVRFKIRWREADLIAQFQLSGEIRAIHKRRVWLKNGGYLVIDRTEALNVIDVNTGKFTGKQDFAATVVQMNVEAAKEIAWQLRLRNLSGIILIDFIDMQQPEDRQLVLDALQAALQRDRVKTSVMGFTQLGLLEMTRKKERAPLTEMMEQPCPLCQERGRVDSAAAVGLRVIADLEQVASRSQQPILVVICHPLVAAWLIGADGKRLIKLEAKLQRQLLLQSNESWTVSNYRVESRDAANCGQSLPVYRGELLAVQVEGTHTEHGSDEGIARLNGFVIQIAGAARLVGRQAFVEITHVMPTCALAKLVQEVTP